MFKYMRSRRSDSAKHVIVNLKERARRRIGRQRKAGKKQQLEHAHAFLKAGDMQLEDKINHKPMGHHCVWGEVSPPD